MLRNENGIALVTTLMLTLIGLGIILCLLYMITESTKISGTNKRYRSVVTATYGGAEILVKDLVPYILKNFESSTLADSLLTDYDGVKLTVSDVDCLKAKITKDTALWSTACASSSTGALPAADSPDITLNLRGDADNTYMVYAKIVATKSGNTSMSGVALEGSSASETSSSITPQHLPYLYTIDAQGKKNNDNSVTSHIEVLYAY